MTDKPYLPYGRQLIDESDIQAVAEVLKSDYLTTGPAVDAFEQNLAELVGAPYAVSCSSGTAALHLACLAGGAGPNDIGIVPSITFVATANALRYCGAEVAFCDVHPTTGLAGPEEFRETLKNCTDGQSKFLMPVHLNGQCADPEAIHALAEDHGLRVIEDACHSIGADYADAAGRRHKIGSCAHSDMTVFSFHPVKAIATGEGGAVTTRDPGLYRRLREYRNHGLVRDAAQFVAGDSNFPLGADAEAPWYYELQTLGFNYRMSDIHAALGNNQLPKLRGFVDKRRRLAKIYDSALKHIVPEVQPVTCAGGMASAYHLYAIRVDFKRLGIDRASLMQKLAKKGVGTQVHYLPVSEQPYYRNRYCVPQCPNAWEYYKSALSLPLYPAMNEEDVHYVVSALLRTIGKN
jgi:UDP-4-amino-4,6-dideoxy-N-acetyl-beta-L-altrosamine transaminase